MTFPDIRLLVPHASSMMLLDHVIAADAESLCAAVIIRPDSLFYRNTPQGAGVDAWVGIEYMAQTIAAYAGYRALQRNESVKVGFLLGTRRYECNHAFFAAENLLQVHARCILQANNGLGSFECSINNANSILASATINAFQPDNLQQFLAGNIHE